MAEMVIGRGADCHVVIDDQYASPRHCRIFDQPDGTVWVEDLGSTNGTMVLRDPGQILKAWGPIQLQPGDRLRVGRTIFNIPAW